MPQTALARMVDYRDDKAETLRCYERSLTAFKTMKELPAGVEQKMMLSLSSREFPMDTLLGDT